MRGVFLHHLRTVHMLCHSVLEGQVDSKHKRLHDGRQVAQPSFGSVEPPALSHQHCGQPAGMTNVASMH
jgi:hypothetical protein